VTGPGSGAAGPYSRSAVSAAALDQMQSKHNPIGSILAGSWRAEPGAANVSETALAGCLPVLSTTGAAGLAWRRVSRNPSLRTTDGAERLHGLARQQAVDAMLHDRALAALATLFEAEGLQPIVFKGAALAPYYAERHLRPMGDVDLCAPPGRFDDLAECFRRNGFQQFAASEDPDRGRVLCFLSPGALADTDLEIDLHEHFERYRLAPLDEVFARARPLQVGARSVLTLAVEDHLRLVALHYLLHGGWRALSLCDIAAMLEAVPPEVDWDLCLGPAPHRRRWLSLTFELAHHLLDARLDALPPECREPRLPEWLTATVLGAWQEPFSDHDARPLLSYVWRHRRRRFLAELLARWPNPIRATVELDAGFSGLPRWPYQLAHFIRSSVRGIAKGLRPQPW
jgi:hypothetical protein